MTIATHVHTQWNGVLVEYRRSPYDPGILHFEHRELRSDGTPHDDRWWPCNDKTLLYLNLHAPEVLDFLWASRPDSGEEAAS